MCKCSSSLEQRRACLSKQIWGWGWRGKLQPAHWTAAWKQNQMQGKRDRQMTGVGGETLAQRPCNFRVVLTQGAQACCRGVQVLAGPLEELHWQLKTFCRWVLCFAQSSSVVSCAESSVTSWQVLLWFSSLLCLSWLLLLVLNWSQQTHFLDLSILGILALLLSLSISAITTKSISKEIKLWRSYIALSRHEK